MQSFCPKINILVVYKTQEGWRGFCSPFDTSCVGDTKKVTFEKLEKITEVYQEALKKYKYPKHLSLRKLSDKKDKEILETIKKDIAKKLSAYIRKQAEKDILKFQQEQQKEKFKVGKNINCFIYQPHSIECSA